MKRFGQPLLSIVLQCELNVCALRMASNQFTAYYDNNYSRGLSFVVMELGVQFPQFCPLRIHNVNVPIQIHPKQVYLIKCHVSGPEIGWFSPRNGFLKETMNDYYLEVLTFVMSCSSMQKLSIQFPWASWTNRLQSDSGH